MELTPIEAANYASDVYYKVKDKNRDSLASSRFNQISADYIRSTIGYPKKNFDTESVHTSFLFETAAGVESYVEIRKGKLIIAIAGSNSWQDWVFNTGYLMRVLRQEASRILGLREREEFKGYRMAYQTLGGYILNYINTYDDLVKEGIVDPITSAAVIGHSAGGMIANHVARSVDRYFSKDKDFRTQLFTFAAPVVYESEKAIDNLETTADTGDRIDIKRYVMANDLVSQALPFFLKKEQKFTTVLPAVSLKKRPHQMSNFVAQIKDKYKVSMPSE